MLLVDKGLLVAISVEFRFRCDLAFAQVLHLLLELGNFALNHRTERLQLSVLFGNEIGLRRDLLLDIADFSLEKGSHLLANLRVHCFQL